MADRILKVLMISTFAVMLGLGIISPLMPIYARDMGANGIWLGLIFSGFSFSRFIFMPIVGHLSDKFGRKKFIETGLFFYSIISLLYIYAYQVYQLVLIRVLHGIFSAMVLPIAMAYVGETSEDGSEGKTMGTFNMALFFGIGSGPFLGGLLHDGFGMNSVFIAMAMLSGLAFIINILYLPDVRQAHLPAKTGKAGFQKILHNDVIKALLLFRAINAMARGGLMAFLPIMAAGLELSSIQIGVLISFNVFLTAVLQRRFGMLADRWNNFYLIITGSFCTSMALGVIPLAENFNILFVIGIVIGLSSALSMPAATALNVKLGKEIGGMGTTVGLFNTAQSVGMIAAPLLSGFVMDLLGMNYIFYVSAALSIFGTIVFYVFIKDRIND